MPRSLPTNRGTFDDLNCYTAGEGRTLLRVHGVNATAAAAQA